MKVCTYDNPATLCRECWQDGLMIRSYALELFCSVQRILPSMYFFGANIGPWMPGRVSGDFAAMHRPELVAG